MSREMVAWGDVVDHQNDLPNDIDTLKQIKGLLE